MGLKTWTALIHIKIPSNLILLLAEEVRSGDLGGRGCACVTRYPTGQLKWNENGKNKE